MLVRTKTHSCSLHLQHRQRQVRGGGWKDAPAAAALRRPVYDLSAVGADEHLPLRGGDAEGVFLARAGLGVADVRAGEHVHGALRQRAGLQESHSSRVSEAAEADGGGAERHLWRGAGNDRDEGIRFEGMTAEGGAALKGTLSLNHRLRFCSIWPDPTQQSGLAALTSSSSAKLSPPFSKRMKKRRCHF